MKGPSTQDASLVDRLDELVHNARAWLISELKLLKAKTEFAARTYIMVFAIIICAAILCAIALVFLAMSLVTVLVPHVGPAAAYALTGAGGLLIAAGLCGYAYRSITKLSNSSGDRL